MQHKIEFELVDKKIGNEEVAGLVSFQFDPIDDVIGKKAIQLIESIASPKVVVGFAGPDDILFFIECDWLIGGIYDGKTLIASESIDEENFNGKVW